MSSFHTESPKLAEDCPQEVDVWWGAYSIRTMIPAYALSACLTVSVWLMAAWLWDENKAHPQLIWHGILAVVVGVWALPLMIGGYRSVGYNYRLTNRAIYRDLGLRHPAAGKVYLNCVSNVVVHSTFLQQKAAIGQVLVFSERSASPLILTGVLQPEKVAALIRVQVQRART